MAFDLKDVEELEGEERDKSRLLVQVSGLHDWVDHGDLIRDQKYKRRKNLWALGQKMSARVSERPVGQLTVARC